MKAELDPNMFSDSVASHILFSPLKITFGKMFPWKKKDI